ncbi:hypothetical protein GCM10027589_01000 [Actinocorallia lasiicapitis]
MNGPALSPDGRFYWDGRAWQPVPSQVVPSQVVPPGPRFSGPQTPGVVRPSSGRAKVALAVVLVAVCAGAGAIGGTAFGYFGTPKQGPDTPGAQAAGFPESRHAFLPDVTIGALVDNWLKGQKNWVCAERAELKPQRGGAHRLHCTPPGDDDLDADFDLEYDEKNQIRYIGGSCTLGTGTVYCTSMVVRLAEKLFPTNKALRAKATAWARKNADSDNSIVVGTVKIVTELSPHGVKAYPIAP